MPKRNQAADFIDYIRIIQRDGSQATIEWLAAHIGGLHQQNDALKKQIAQLKRRLTQLEKR